MKFRTLWVFAVFLLIIGLSFTIAAPTRSSWDPTPDTIEEVDAVKFFRIFLPFTKLEPTKTPLPSPTASPVPQSTDFLTRMINRVNQHRLNNGCQIVQLHPVLRDVAIAHSKDMAINDFFGHTGSDGLSVGDRVLEAGYAWSRIGEVIAAGYTTPEATVDAWMASSTHKPILLNCSYVHAGPGYYYLANDTGGVNFHHYWTLILTAPY